MNYVEIIARQEELQIELNELQEARIKCAQSHEDITVELELGESITVELTMDYDSRSLGIITLTDTREGDIVLLSVDQFNKINQFLGKYNDAIFSYMSEITKVDTDETVTEA